MEEVVAVLAVVAPMAVVVVLMLAMVVAGRPRSHVQLRYQHFWYPVAVSASAMKG